MVVEDDPDASEILCVLLEILGHECKPAASGRDALELASELRPEVVLVDISLPDMSGYDVGRALRVDSQSEAPYLIALTGFCGHEHRARSFQAGFDEHLVKPIDRTQLGDVISRAGATERG
jgi:CheY-like chemotaxis protein